MRADLDPGDGVDTSASAALTDALRRLDDPHSRAAVAAERSLLAALEAGCSAPIGALAVIEDGSEPTVHLRAVLARQDGSLVHMSGTGPVEQAELIGRRLAGELLAGTHGMLDQAAMTGPTTDRRPITAAGPFGVGGPTPVGITMDPRGHDRLRWSDQTERVVIEPEVPLTAWIQSSFAAWSRSSHPRH